MLNRTLRNPSRIICPASVPTVEEERPEHKSATAKMVAEAGPSSGPSVRWASSMDISLRPLPAKAAAATITMAEFTSQAPFMAVNTSSASRRRWRSRVRWRDFRGVLRPLFRSQPGLHQAGVQINNMGHHRSPQHAYRNIDASPIQPRHRRVVGDLPPVGMHQENFDEVTKPDDQNKHHDPDLERTETA